MAVTGSALAQKRFMKTMKGSFGTSKPPCEDALQVLANPHLPIAALFKYLSLNGAIHESQVIESRVYIMRGALATLRPLAAPRRKILLKIGVREDGSQFWLQLERMPTSRMALVRGLGTTPSNDIGRVGDNLEDLMGFSHYVLESKIVLRDNVSLGDMSLIIQAMGEVLVQYNLFSSNSSTFCAVLQDVLDWNHQGFIQYGGLVCANIYNVARQRVRARVEELYTLTDPPFLIEMLDFLSRDVQFRLVLEATQSAKSALITWMRADRRKSQDLGGLVSNAVNAFITLSTQLAARNSQDKAIAINIQVVSLLRRLTHVTPTTYRPPLVTVLQNHGTHLFRLWQGTLASSIRQEALQVAQCIYNDDPQLYSSAFLSNLLDLGESLYHLNRHRDAVQLQLKAVAMARSLHAQEPTSVSALEAHLKALGNLSFSLMRMLRLHESRIAITEAVEMTRYFFVWNPTASRLLLRPLEQLGRVLIEMEEYEDACTVYKEAVTLMSQDNGLSIIPRVLAGYSFTLHRAGRVQEAESIARESVGLLKSDPSNRAKNPGGDLPVALRIFGVILMDRGHVDEALKTLSESLEILEPLYSSHPQVYIFYLAQVRPQYAKALLKLERYSEGLCEIDEAITLWKTLLLQNPLYFKCGLIHSLGVRHTILMAMHRYQQARDVIMEALELIGEFARVPPGTFVPDFGGLLCEFEASLKLCGKDNEVEAALQDVILGLGHRKKRLDSGTPTSVLATLDI